MFAISPISSIRNPPSAGCSSTRSIAADQLKRLGAQLGILQCGVQFGDFLAVKLGQVRVQANGRHGRPRELRFEARLAGFQSFEPLLQADSAQPIGYRVDKAVEFAVHGRQLRSGRLSC